MPNDAPRPCRAFACGRTTTEKAGYCDKHKHLGGWHKWQQDKGTAAQRGYGYAWRKLRQRVLKRDGELCQSCLKEGRITRANHVDHIVPKASGGGDKMSNLQSLCKPCHEAKTAKERKVKATRARRLGAKQGSTGIPFG